MYILDIDQLDYYHPMLRSIERFIHNYFGCVFVITSQSRPGKGGIHDTTPLRANDLRWHDRATGEMICEIINMHYQYDHTRPDKQVAIYHDAGSGYHIHIQVHEETKRRLINEGIPINADRGAHRSTGRLSDRYPIKKVL